MTTRLEGEGDLRELGDVQFLVHPDSIGVSTFLLYISRRRRPKSARCSTQFIVEKRRDLTAVLNFLWQLIFIIPPGDTNGELKVEPRTKRKFLYIPIL